MNNFISVFIRNAKHNIVICFDPILKYMESKNKRKIYSIQKHFRLDLRR